MDIIAKLSEELSIKQSQIEAAVGLIDEGNTIPFIARYRKEVTGSLDDEQLRALSERLAYLRGLEKRKEEVRAAITEQGKIKVFFENNLLTNPSRYFFALPFIHCSKNRRGKKK